MNKQEIEQLQYIEKEITMLEEKIRKVVKEKTQNRLSEARYICPMLIDEKKKDEINEIIEDYERMITNSVKRLYEKRNIIESYIENLDDSELRMILRMRFIDIYSWQKIAHKMGKTDESTPRKRVTKFFGENE